MIQANRFENVKFTQVTLQNSTASTRKRYFWLALIVTKLIILVIIPGGVIYYKAHFFYSQKDDKSLPVQNETFTPETDDCSCENFIKIFNANQWSLKLKGSDNYGTEFSYCKESWSSLESIPAVYEPPSKETKSICVDDIKNFINVHILLIFDRIINKYSWKLLNSIFSEYHRKLLSITNIEDFIKFINSFDSHRIKFYTAHMKEHDWNLQLSDFQNVFAFVKELNYWYQYLCDLEKFLADYEQQKQREFYRAVITEKNFDVFVSETKKNLFSSKHDFFVTKKKLQEINELISKWTEATAIEKNEKVLKISNKRLLISEVVDYLKTNDSIRQNIYIFASDSLFLDEDLELPGINVALIAPSWTFFRKIKINLNGIDGKSFDWPAKHGQPGEPGYPGGHGGDFLGIGDADFEFLIVLNNGGKGGPGQNGQAGSSGANYTTPDILKTPKCILKGNSYHGVINPLATFYKIFNELGCGKDGTDGGVGGFGGKGGKVWMINKSKEKFSTGLNGTSGIPGKGGQGGAGSLKGCYYEAAFIEEKAIPVTKVNCFYDTVLPSGKPGNDNANSQNQSQPNKKIHLNFSDSILKYYQFVGAYLKDNHVLNSFLSEQSIWEPTLAYTDFVKKFKIIDNLKNLKLYELFQKEIRLISENNQSTALDFLTVITKGKILILKHDIDYGFVNLHSYLNIIQENIENVKDEPSTKYQTSILKNKLDDKLNKIKMNLESFKPKLKIVEESSYNFIQNLMEKSTKNENQTEKTIRTEDLITSLFERRVTYLMQIVFEIMDVYVQKISVGYLTKGEETEFKNFVCRQILNFNIIERKKKDFLNSFSEFSASERQILSQYTAKEIEMRKYKFTYKKIIKFLPDLTADEKELINAVEEFSVEGLKREKMKKMVEILKKTTSVFSDLLDFRSELKYLIEEFVENLSHLIELDKLLQWCKLEEDFKTSLDNLSSKKTNVGMHEDEKFLKSELNNAIVEIYYKLAVDAVGQKVWPFLQLKKHLEPINNRTVADEGLLEINRLRHTVKNSRLCRNKHHAVFESNSVAGEFYFWPNEKIQLKIKKLFQGLPIYIKADINNHHVLDKNLVRMKSVRLEFMCREYENSKKCKNVFFDNIIHFKVELTHSGYSSFNWKGDIFTIVSDELTLDFSLKTEKNGEPEFYNTIFKSLEHGGINISPFTSWKIQLIPINPLANFGTLMSFSDRIDLRLVGIGTFFT